MLSRIFNIARFSEEYREMLIEELYQIEMELEVDEELISNLGSQIEQDYEPDSLKYYIRVISRPRRNRKNHKQQNHPVKPINHEVSQGREARYSPSIFVY
jgi:hypothetical protein